jgi:ABC-type transport system involved in multi-copper enzyme maturation permease subunit
MIDVAPEQTSATAAKTGETLRPTFLGALRGMWLFTWKGRLTWHRAPTALLILLILPALIYLTTRSPESWSQRHPLFGSPMRPVKVFGRQLKMAQLPLQPQQNRDVLAIFVEEYAQAEKAWRETKTPDFPASGQSARVKACYERISRRLEDVLDDRQFAQWQRYERQLISENGSGGNERNAVLIDFYFFVILPLSCVGACGALIREELQTDTLGFLTTRPLTRARLMVVKYLSQSAWLQIILLVQALLLFAAGGLREIPALRALLPLFLAVQFIAILAWSALGAFLGLVTKRYMAIALLYGFIVEMGIGRIPTNINTLSMMRHLKSLLANNAALQEVYQWPMRSVAFSVVALCLGAVVFLSLAAFMFTFKEYHHTAEMQK